MGLDTGIMKKIKRFVYSRVLWIIILNAILILIPISGLTIIRSRDYKALNLRSIATRDLSRSIISCVNLSIPPEIIENLPVIAPYQRVLIIDSEKIEPVYDTGWLTNSTIESFEYDLFLTRFIDGRLKEYSSPQLSADEIIKRMNKYLKGGVEKLSIIDYRFLYTIKNFDLDDGTRYSLIVLVDKSDLLKSTKIYKILLLIITFFSLLIGIIVSSVYFILMIKPLHVLTEEVELVKDRKTDLGKIFSMKERVDEIGLLSKAFYLSSRELIQQRESLKIFTNDVLHELKNPLTGIRNGIEILQLNNDATRESVELYTLISKESGRIEKLLFDIREYSLSNKEEGFSKYCDPAEIIHNILNLYSQAEVRSTIQNNESVKLSEGQFISVLTNLIDNAISFSPGQGSVSLDYYAEGNKSYLSVKDSGPGISPGEKDKIFNRFYSNRGPADSEKLHSGLGLSIVKNILDNNNHSIKCMDNSPCGTIFLITFHNC